MCQASVSRFCASYIRHPRHSSGAKRTELSSTRVRSMMIEVGNARLLSERARNRKLWCEMAGLRGSRARNSWNKESELAGDLGQHRQQRGAVGGAEEFVETGLVLVGNEPFGPREHRAPLVGQEQDVRAAVAGRAHSFTQ